MIELQDRIQTLLNSEPNSELDYYALSLFLAEKGTPSYSCFSGWVGFTDDKPPREIREASLVHADRMLNTWRKLVEPAMVIESATDFGLYFAFGGHALIEKQLAEILIPDWLAPCTVVNVGENGFVSPASLPETAMQRVPSKKLRMQILKRDNLRCRICGRRPSDYLDLELHVHHIRPWANGGITEESNLITLCQTCHNGLDPHFEYSLFELMPKDSLEASELYRKKLLEYQNAVSKQ